MSKQKTVNVGPRAYYYEEFKSLGEFYDVAKENVQFEFPVIKEAYEISQSNTKWTMTESFDEAVELAYGGWSEGSVKLTEGMKKISLKERKAVRQYFNDVCGFQAMVPLYLNGVPTNMLNQRVKMIKNKVITVNKMIGFLGHHSADEMLKLNASTLSLINDLEQAGYRVNLNVLYCSNVPSGSKEFRVVKIRAKSANEKLNVSKLAFPLCHPSMHRRIYFNYLNVRRTNGVSGSSQYGENLIDHCKATGMFKGEYILPQKLSTVQQQGEDILDCLHKM